MSEKDMRNPEIGANVPTEEIIEEKQPVEAAERPEQNAEPEWDAEKENAPAEKKAESKPAKKGKKRKKNRVPVQVAVTLAAIGLIFGVILGYTIGRGSANNELAEAQIQIAELSAQSVAEEAANTEAPLDNDAALADLSGASMMADSSELTIANDMLQGAEGEEPAAEAEQVVVAEFGGGQLMSGEVLEEYNDQLTTYLFAGYTEEEIASTLLDEVLRYMVSDKILEVKAKEMGLYDLTSVDQERIAAQAQQDYAEQVAFYESFVSEAGMSAEERTAAAQDYLLEMEGVTLETVQADIQAGWWMQKLYDEMVKDVAVESGDILSSYNEQLAMQQETFTAYPEDFELASMTGEVILYNLPDYRAVRMLLLPFESAEASLAVADITEVISELDPQADADEIAEYQAQIDAYYASAEDTARQVLDQLNAGADFNAMLDQYGGDEGMKDAAIREKGYYVSANSVIWSQSMIDAAMALAQAGEISDPVRTDEGVCILQYVGEVPVGTVDMAKVYDAVSAETLEEARYQAYEGQVNIWLAEAGAKYYPERLQ